MLCNWSYKWSWRARSNSIENESVFPLKSSRVTSKIHFSGKCLANSNSGSFCVAVFICLFWPLICKLNHQLLNLVPHGPLASESEVGAALQAVSSRQTSKPPQVHFGWYGKSGTRARGGEEPAGLCHAASGRGASFSKSCQPLPGGSFVGGREFFLTWADERRGNLRDRAGRGGREGEGDSKEGENFLCYFCHQKQHNLELHLFKKVGKQAGHLGHRSYMVLHKGLIHSEVS